MMVLGGSASLTLAQDIGERLGSESTPLMVERFPDGEMHVEITASVRGKDTYIVQATTPPVEGNLLELLFAADACRRAGSARITAVVPYFGYARQDRRANGREPIAARLIADILSNSGIERIVAVDLHGTAMEGFFSVPLEHLTAVPTLAVLARASLPSESILLAPDLGAAKLAELYAGILHLPVAIVHKARLSGSEVSVRTITGDVAGRALVIVDDMISSGGTVEAAARAALDAGARNDVLVITSHALLVGPAVQRLGALPLRGLIVSDTVPAVPGMALPVQVASVAPLLADAVGRLHHDESLADLILHR